ncbi:MAG: outer membrane beta-barrel protein [Ekhidna sp.]
MKSILTFVALTVLINFSFGQYWFGPKVGVSYIDHVYQDKTYERDSFNVDSDVNMQFGFALSYSATDRYSVYGEILYERIGKTLRDKGTNGESVYSNMTNHFISVPVMLRITLGKVPFHYFVNGGPRLSYWVGGKGTHDLAAFEEFLIDDDGNPIVVDYKLRFNSDNASPDDFSTAYVSQPNRLQFGLALGGGVYFDLASGGRLMIDFRYTWVHSNMATNTGNDINLIRGSSGDLDFYRENLEYYNNIATVGVAYLFGYNSDLKRKGKSTSSESNKKKK